MIERSRFESKVEKGPGCWEWRGTRDSYGYGVIKHEGKMFKAHRLAAFFATGKMPVLFVCHECNNPGCVRWGAGHLYEGTNTDNMKDARAAGTWRPGEYQSDKKICIRGHELSGATLFTLPGNDGRGKRRGCRTCRSLRKNPAWRKRHGFDNIYTKRQWLNPTMSLVLRAKGIHLGAALLLLVSLSGCATIGDLEAETVRREAMAKGVEAQDKHFVEKINQTIDRVKVIEDRLGSRGTLIERVRYLEQVVAPNDPDGLLEDPDLYQSDSERKRFYRLWERTECGE